MAKLPDNELPWSVTKDGELISACAWFDNVRSLPKLIAKMVRGWITNQFGDMEQEMQSEAKDILASYTQDHTEKEIVEYVDTVISSRKAEMENLILAIKGQVKH